MAEPSEPGTHTRAVHLPVPPPPSQPPIGLPVYRTAVFGFDTAEAYADVLADPTLGYVYSRIDNPTADAFVAGLTALEAGGLPVADGQAAAGQPFASGMAAISSTLIALCSAGSHVVVQRQVYGGTYGLLAHVLARFGVAATFVDDVEGARAALRPETALVWAETIANPMLTVADLPGLAAVAHEAAVPLVVDSTFATPVVCRPLAHGADLVVHSATKYIGGHSDVTGGAVIGHPDLVRAIRATRIDLGGALAPDEAFLLHRGLATLPLRVERHCANAGSVARALVGHPAVAAVHYPGLPSHVDHQLAVELFEKNLFGGVVTVVPVGGREAGQAFCNRLRLATNATSLGGTHTVVSHVASTTHRQLDDAALAGAGIDPAAVRISVGLEDAEDIVADLVAALEPP
ncbi:MAG TPA: aminotransferase class I/II-fold pyridoxal phosphate-dependent enzyme [Mycobacteriales bacterium]|nr:aminotransferase class I/II-fold pyridoxal phosphate-dependent enzyme [Mycobacteriales bacterium]